jgi:hypothetical protein
MSHCPPASTPQSPFRNLDPGVKDLGISPALNNGGGGDAAEMVRPRLISSLVVGLAMSLDPGTGLEVCTLAVCGTAGAVVGGAGGGPVVDVGAGSVPGPGDTGRLTGMAETETGRRLCAGACCPDSV